MPPRVAAEGSGAPVISTKAEEEVKLLWAILCQISKQGKLNGIDWEAVRVQLGANSVKTCQNKYYLFRDRMKEIKLPLPEADPSSKPVKTPTKRKEKTPAAEGEGIDAPVTPKKRKVKSEGDTEGASKKTPKKKTAKQLKADKEAEAAAAAASGSSGEDSKEVIDGEVNENVDGVGNHQDHVEVETAIS